jgi:hypothetical protein
MSLSRPAGGVSAFDALFSDLDVTVEDASASACPEAIESQQSGLGEAGLWESTQLIFPRRASP